MSKPNRKTFQQVIIAICVSTLAVPAVAQRGRGSETDLLRREEVRTELGLSETQNQGLEELQKNSSPGRDFFEPFLKRIADTTDKDEQTKIREEMNAAVGKARLQFQEKAVEILNPEQKKKLRGVFLRSAGTRALTDPAIAKEYGLTEEQATTIADLSEQRRAASRDLGFNASEEDREKFTTEWQQKLTAVLTDEQKARLEKETAYGEQPDASAVASTTPTPGAAGTPMPELPSGQPVISTFGSDTTPGERKLVKEFSFNFRGAPWEQVLQMYADGAGLTLDLNDIPPGTFSHFDGNKYSPRKTLDILNGYLLRKGYAVIENDGFLIVLNVDNGIPAYLIPSATIEELLKIGDDFVVGDHQLANVTFPIDGMDTARAAQEVEAIVGPHGSLIALTESQILIVTDVGGSLRRIHALLTAAMSKSKPDALMFKSYALTHIDAEEAEIQVMTQFGMRQNVANVSYNALIQSRTQSRNQSRTQTPPPAAPAKTEPQVQIASDLRLNSLLVTGTTKQHQLVESILESLDVGEDASGSPLSRNKRGTYLEVYSVKSANALEVTKTLSAMNLPGVTVVNEDSRAGRIHILATQRQHEEVAALVRQLDGGGAVGTVTVIQLSQMDPLSAAATLRSLFYDEGDDAPTIETDMYGRRLIVRGSIDHITQIKQVLADLGEDGTGIRDRGDGGTVRRFSLQGRNPDDFVKILQQAWDAKETQKINIVIPNESGPIRNRRTTGEVESTEEAKRPERETRDNLSQRSTRPKTLNNDRWNTWKRPANSVNDDEFISVKSSQTDEQSAPAKTDQQPGDEGLSGLDVIVYGDELILSSPDEKLLDRLEDLLDDLQQSMPFKPEYTVVYLKSADALEAADMLSQFFPSSSVASTSVSSSSSMLGSLGSSMSSMGSSLMDATGLSGLGASPQSLRIIPDSRTNSLFLTGPQMMIKDALVFLDVLDSNDIPESLKDMQPHFIDVKYADIRDVENHVKEVFKIYTEAQGGGRQQQQQNPLAAMFGGGGRGGSDPSQQVRMLVDANEQTSTLTVYSNQGLFEEVESVVRKMDEDTRNAKPGIRVIQLKHADASQIQQSLTSLLPRVSVSASRTNSSTSTSTSPGGSAPQTRPSSNPQQEAFNRLMQQRAAGGGRTGAGGTGGTRTGGGGRGGAFGGAGGGFPGGGFGGRGGAGGRGR